MKQFLKNLQNQFYKATKLVSPHKLNRICLLLTGLLIGQMAWGQSPGGVSSNLRVWFKANDGPNTTTNGGSISSWLDKSGNAYNIGQATAARQPKYVTSSWNFNPNVSFNLNSIGNTLANSIIPSTTNPVTLVQAYQCTRTASGYNTVVSFGGAGDYPSDQVYNGTLRTYVDQTAPIFSDHPTPIGTNVVVSYSTHANLAGAAGTRQLGYNGMSNKFVPTMTNGDFTAGGVSNQFSLGAERPDNLVEDFLGYIPEVVVYNKVLSNLELQKVQSYLCVKYGLTMDNTTSYLNSAGTTIWTANTTYDNGIFGLMKDDGSGLNQRVSQAVNTGTASLILSLNGDYTSLNNAASRTTSLTNMQSFMVADDNISMSTKTGFAASCTNPSAYILSRKWKAQNVGNVGTVYFTVRLSTSGINASPKMVIWSTSNVMREVGGVMNGDGTANFAAVVKDGETFTFAGEVVAGICTTCTDDGSLVWKTKTWPIPSATNTAVNYTLSSDLSASIIFNDPENVEYAKNVRPIKRGSTLMLDRFDKMTPTGTANGGAYTGVIDLDKASLVRFKIHAIDRWARDCKDIVEVKGYCGTTLITPKLSYVLAPNKSSYTISGNIATGNNLWSGYFDKRGMANVEFDRPVDKIEIIWKSTKGGTVKRFQRIGLSDMTFDCPDAQPCINNDDNVTFVKKTNANVTAFKTCENVSFEYTVKNLNCADKVVNISDVLPAGMTWVADSYEEGDIVGTPNAYAGTGTFTLTNATIPAGQTKRFYVTAQFTNLTANTYANRATMTVNGGVAGTIQSSCGNTTWSSTPGAPPPVPTISQTINKTCYNQNEIATVTVTFNNTSGAAITDAEYSSTFQDNFVTVAGSISNLFGGTVSIPDGATGYGDLEILEISSMTIPTGISTFTYQINPTSSDTIVPFSASISADPNADCSTEAVKNSNVINLSLCPPCQAGTTAPTLSATTATNTCPATKVNLSTITASNMPAGTRLTWHTATPATLANKVADSTQIAASGTYYAAFTDFTNNCIGGSGTATSAVTVTLKLCTNTPSVSTPPAGGSGGGNAVTELNPAGGTAPYTYSNGSSDPACTAPVGATPLPASSNLVVNSNGTYSYITPTTQGTYYFCIKICDNTMPTAICTVSTYTINVACGAGAASPSLSASSAMNLCPATTVNLSGITATNLPAGAKLTWHTATPATLANKVTDSTAVAAGSTYYAAFYDFANGCFGNGGANTAAVTTSSTSCTSILNLTAKVFLSGNFDQATGMMHDSLRVKNLIPSAQPYATMGYSGTETVAPSVLTTTGNNAIVDWVLVELRDATTPTTIIAKKAGLLQRDGDIVGTDGVSPLSIAAASGSYNIAVRHRNHLGVMTASAIALSSTATTVDFTSTTTANYQKSGITGSVHAQKTVGSKRALWAGNSNGDTQVIFASGNNDTDPIYFSTLSAPANAAFASSYIINNVYGKEDVNLDGRVIYQSVSNELDIILFDVLSYPTNASFLNTYIIYEQLP